MCIRDSLICATEAHQNGAEVSLTVPVAGVHFDCPLRGLKRLVALAHAEVCLLYTSRCV